MIREASALCEQLPDGRYAINLHTNRCDFLRGFCAALLAGHSTLMPSNRQPDTLAELEQTYPGSYRLGNGKDMPADDASLPAGSISSASPMIDDEQTAVIAFTSGSTGQPVATAKSWQTLRDGTENNFKALLGDISQGVNLLATVPSQHMWGFETSVLLPLLAPVTLSERNPLYPIDVASALAELPEPRVLVTSPLHLGALMKSGVSVPSLLRIFTATAPLDAADARQLEAHFECEIIDVFGCSESGVIATRRTAQEAAWRLTPPFRLEVSEGGTTIHGAHLPDPVHLPDVIELIDDTSFRWLGRDQDMLNIAGKRGSLADLTRRIATIEGVQDGIMFLPEGAQRLAALVVAPNLTSKDVTRALKPQVDPAFIPRPVYMVESIPRLETGKLARADMLRLFESVRAGNTAAS